MAKSTLSLRLDEEIISRLDRIAKALDRSRSWVIADAIRLYIETEGKDIEAILEGIASADAGDFATQEEIDAIFDRFKRPAEAAE